MKNKRILGLVLVAGLLLFAAMVINVAPSVSAQLGFQLPPTATPGPEPTLIPETRAEAPVKSEADAILRVVDHDSIFTMREQSLTAARPEMFAIKYFATRQEASNATGGGVFTDPVVASEPVWMVTVKGETLVRNVGMRAAFKPTSDASRVVYIISANTGEVRSFWAVPAKSVTP